MSFLCALYSTNHTKRRNHPQRIAVYLFFFWKMTCRIFLSSYQSKALHWLMVNNFYAGSVPLQRTTTYRQICLWSTTGQGFWNSKTIVAWPNLIFSCRELLTSWYISDIYLNSLVYYVKTVILYIILVKVKLQNFQPQVDHFNFTLLWQGNGTFVICQKCFRRLKVPDTKNKP